MEYLLECPAPEVRLVFSKLIVLVAHCSKNDPPQPVAWAPLKHLAGELRCANFGAELFDLISAIFRFYMVASSNFSAELLDLISERFLAPFLGFVCWLAAIGGLVKTKMCMC